MRSGQLQRFTPKTYRICRYALKTAHCFVFALKGRTPCLATLRARKLHSKLYQCFNLTEPRFFSVSLNTWTIICAFQSQFILFLNRFHAAANSAAAIAAVMPEFSQKCAGSPPFSMALRKFSAPYIRGLM